MKEWGWELLVYILHTSIGGLGRRRKGSPQHNRTSWFEVGDGYTIENPAVAP